MIVSPFRRHKSGPISGHLLEYLKHTYDGGRGKLSQVV